MDSSQYHSNPLSSNNSQFSSLPGISPHQLQHNASLPPHTLPPLQSSQHATMQSMYGGSGTHTPRTPATPNTPGSANTMGSFPQIASQSRGYQMMPGNSFQQQQHQPQPPPQHQQQQHHQQQQQPYRTSSSMMVQSSTAMSHPQPIAPAPAQNRMPQTLRPMPPNGLQQHMHPGMPSPYGQGMMMLQDMEPPTHVVGSQGRRGILPSAPGRPAPAVTGTGSAKSTMIPAKDADGKFPCPHCTKTYLHAKHLKRHLLRHTGDRPYMCVLCRDTFSRSDILKRHFQKCSIRRGNPTGASHLSHAQAHLKKSHPHKAAPSMNDTDLMAMNGMGAMGHDPAALHPFGVIADGSVPGAGANLTDEQAGQLTRANSLKPMGNGDGGDGRSMAGVGPGGSSRTSFDQSYAGVIASTMPPGMNPSLAFNMPNGQNGHSYSQGYDFATNGNGSTMPPQSTAGDISTLQQQQQQQQQQEHPRNVNVYPGAGAGPQPGLDWAQMFQPQANDGYIPQSQYNPSTTISQAAIKSETLNSASPASSGLFHGVYPSTVNGLPPTTSSAPGWNLQNDPLHEISGRLLYYCFPANQVIGRSSELRGYLSAGYIKHFLENFTHFQGHFPIIHMPTFRIADAYDGLLLGMMCVGAVYSDRVTPIQVRDLMELAKSSIERNSPLFASQDQKDGSGFAKEAIGTSKSELEQITAIFLMQVVFTWHGTPLQREQARRQFPMTAGLARRAGLTIPTTTAPFSVLHQRHVKLENFTSASFDWNAWVEQEKRSRLLYAIFVTDAAMVVYFNATPLFDTREIRLPLPADDAAWDARTALECAEALGLQGPLAARDRNPEGTRRPKQPEMHSALETLLRPDLDLQPGTTNLYSKFLLVHALHVQLWMAQKQYSQESGQLTAHTPLPGSGSSTPLSQGDWVMIKAADVTGSGPHSASSSGRATPIKVEDQVTPSHQLLQTINHGFDKWKRVWDEDMAVQYPPSSSAYRRFGFCRDSVHFYFLSKYLMKNNRGLDWKLAPDQRFSQIMNLLKYVKSWVASDTAKRGEEPGSVSDIDNEYGVRDLTLDMAQLFKPINKHSDSPVAGVHTGGGMP